MGQTLKRRKKTRRQLKEPDDGTPLKRRHKTSVNIRTVLTQGLVRKFCRIIRRGLPADGATDYLGITPSTYWSWVRKGELYLSGDQEPASHAIYAHFLMEFRRATAAYRLERLDEMHRGGNRQWFRELAIMERRDRLNFGRNEPSGGGATDYDPDDRFL